MLSSRNDGNPLCQDERAQRQGVSGYEGLGFGYQAVREVPHHSSQGRRAGDLHEPATQAAPGLDIGALQLQLRICDVVVRRSVQQRTTHGTYLGC
jgi:hypothetical protein